MAVMTVSEARAVLPEVLTRVAQGEEITITRYGSPIAVVVRPDVVWSQPAAVGIEVGVCGRDPEIDADGSIIGVDIDRRIGAKPLERPGLR